MADSAHLAFTLALHRAAASDPRQNACWSPYSVASALGLALLGAGGLTHDELALLLLGDKADMSRTLAKTQLDEAARLGRVATDDEPPVLAVTNTLWADESIHIRSSYVDLLEGVPGGSVRAAPFRKAPDEARDLINGEVSETTRGLINDLVPRGAIGKDTRAALVNALYLKCAWRKVFVEGATRPRAFHSPGGTVEVPTMELNESVGYAATGGWQVVSLPAVGGVRAVILLPDKDLAAAEPELDAGSLARLLDAPSSTDVRLRLPTVDVSDQFELSPPLKALGVRTMFTDDADFGGISPDPLAVEAVLHKSVLKLDEQGLEGAAATAIMFRVTSMTLGEPVTVRVDRPFLLLIQHEASGVVYFLARVVTP